MEMLEGARRDRALPTTLNSIFMFSKTDFLIYPDKMDAVNPVPRMAILIGAICGRGGRELLIFFKIESIYSSVDTNSNGHSLSIW